MIARYRDALSNELPLYVRELLEHHLEEIGISSARLRDFSTAHCMHPERLRRQTVGPILIANWWSFVVRGAVTLLVGVVVFNSSASAPDALVALFAIYALGDGLVGVRGRDASR